MIYSKSKGKLIYPIGDSLSATNEPNRNDLVARVTAILKSIREVAATEAEAPNNCVNNTDDNNISCDEGSGDESSEYEGSGDEGSESDSSSSGEGNVVGSGDESDSISSGGEVVGSESASKRKLDQASDSSSDRKKKKPNSKQQSADQEKTNEVFV